MQGFAADVHPGSYTDEQLINQILHGQRELFEIFVHRHSRRLYRIAAAILRSENDAEDVVQDTLCSAYEHLAQFAGRASFTTWLTRIAIYRALALKSRRREVALQDDEGQPIVPLVDRRPTPEQTVCAQEDRVALCAAINALPASYRRVVVLRDIAEIDTSTTARKLRLTETNVKVRLHRARTMLRRCVTAAHLPTGILTV